MASHLYSKPKLHNAAWPGVVGKGEGSEPPIGLMEMLDLTAAAEVDGQRFDGIDLFLAAPHVDIDSTDEQLEELAREVRLRGLVVGSLVAPVWPGTGGGSAMGDDAERQRFLTQVRKACGIAQALRQLGVRSYGVVRIDSACSPGEWNTDPERNTQLIADTFRQACDIAESCGERLAAEGEICWGGMHSAQSTVALLEAVNRPATLGFQADMAHTLLFMLGYNAEQDRLAPPDFRWDDEQAFDAGYTRLTDLLRPWTIDFHVAQNNGEVFGSGSHDKTGRHCVPDAADGKLDIVKRAGAWLRENSVPTRRLAHICWDGCMFPNDVLRAPRTWNTVLSTMIAVRDAHGWD
jgi:sugar phosphate isomerase/epimerase